MLKYQHVHRTLCGQYYKWICLQSFPTFLILICKNILNKDKDIVRQRSDLVLISEEFDGFLTHIHCLHVLFNEKWQ